MKLETRLKLRAANRAYWTPERRAEAKVRGRENYLRWKREQRVHEMIDRAGWECGRNNWESCSIHDRLKFKMIIEDDSADWEFIGGRIVRTKLYGKPLQ